ncbi:MAG: hypothetical protein HYX47_11180 [Burkholderiales bacterium]|nr:hypothetical protein [Burkholderiales bacterium]
MEHLELDLMTPRGFAVRAGAPRAAQYPLALTADGRPVYGTSLQKPPPSSIKRLGMMVYDDEVERQRRLLADSVLGQLMVEKPRHAQRAVTRVSRGIRAWWMRKSPGLTRGALAKPVATAQSYVYGATSYGRLTGAPMPLETDVTADLPMLKGIVEGWLAVLDGKYLPKVMSLQDYFGRIFKALGPSDSLPSAETARYELMLRKVRPGWYDDVHLRGRENLAVHQKKMMEKNIPGYKSKPLSVSFLPGLITPDFTIAVAAPLARAGLDLGSLHLEGRNRGTDMFLTNATEMDDSFRRSLGKHNLNFSASASGTTATIFASAAVFANLENWTMEDKKEFVLACLSYLVAGGMHTCHEVFWTARLLGVPYVDGKYAEMMPRTFMQSPDYAKWSGEFWEFARGDRVAVRG